MVRIGNSGRLFILVLLIGIFFMGCTKLRGYVARDKGFVSLRVKKLFGQGEEIKEFYVSSNGAIINIHDTQDRVFSVLGRPDRIESIWEGYQIWVYGNERLKIYFEDGYVKGLQKF